MFTRFFSVIFGMGIGLAAAIAKHAFVLRIRCFADSHTRAVVEQDLVKKHPCADLMSEAISMVYVSWASMGAY